MTLRFCPKAALIGITEHIENENSAYIIVVNYSDKTVETELKIKDGFHISNIIRGDVNNIAPYDTTIIKVIRK